VTGPGDPVLRGQAADRASDDEIYGGEGLDLRLEGAAAVDRNHSRAQARTRDPEIIGNLDSEFPGGHDDEGARRRAPAGGGSSSRCRIGMPNASVLPVPVLACPMRSCPSSAIGRGRSAEDGAAGGGRRAAGGGRRAAGASRVHVRVASASGVGCRAAGSGPPGVCASRVRVVGASAAAPGGWRQPVRGQPLIPRQASLARSCSAAPSLSDR
jgi:hypothetical protein